MINLDFIHDPENFCGRLDLQGTEKVPMFVFGDCPFDENWTEIEDLTNVKEEDLHDASTYLNTLFHGKAKYMGERDCYNLGDVETALSIMETFYDRYPSFRNLPINFNYYEALRDAEMCENPVFSTMIKK